MTARYTVTGDKFVAEKPQVWITKLGGSVWDLAPDGRRVAVLTPLESTPVQEHKVVIVLNFVDELRRRLAPAK
jgi:hypothetical protein